MDLPLEETITCWIGGSVRSGSSSHRIGVQSYAVSFEDVVVIGLLFRGEGSEVSDLDSDGTIIGWTGMPGSFLDVEGLVDGAVDIEQKMTGKTTDVMQDMKTPARRTTCIIMKHNGIDDLCEIFKTPTLLLYLLQQRITKSSTYRTISSNTIGLIARAIELRFVMSVSPVSVISAGVDPQDYWHPGVYKPASYDDFIAFSWC